MTGFDRQTMAFQSNPTNGREYRLLLQLWNASKPRFQSNPTNGREYRCLRGAQGDRI
jgi:hypothetical protein